MKADVLNIFTTIKVCTHYQLSDGTITETMPYEYITQKITPVYSELKGWNCSLAGITKSSIPKELNEYVTYLEKALQVPITVISIGPDRTQTILK
jgi:adenylosuccinate synthase